MIKFELETCVISKKTKRGRLRSFVMENVSVLKDISISLGSFATVFVLLYLACATFEFFAG